VRINVKDEEMRKFAMDCIMQAGANLENIEFYFTKPMMLGAEITALLFN
jgi:agmatine deiminase